MNREIQEYLECAEEMRLQLENTYQYCMFNGDKVGAHEAVKSMMEYRLIDKDDPRVSINTKIFAGNNGVDVKKRENWGFFDYRRSDTSNFIPRYLFAKIGSYETFFCQTLPHWGKRVEGNYEGDIKIPEHPIKFKVKQLIYQMESRGALNDIERFYKENGATFPNIDEMREMVKVGVVRLFSIEVMSNVLSKYSNFGWAMLKMDDNGVLQVKTIIKYEAVYSNWVDIQEFVDRLSNSLMNLCGGNAVVGHMVNSKFAKERQANMMKAERIKDNTHLELVRKQEEEAKRKEAEKAAKKAAKKTKNSNN